MPSRSATPRPLPSHKQRPTLQGLLSEAPRWVVKRGPGGQPERLTLYKGKRPVAICSVSLRLMPGVDKGAQKALHTAAETLEALTAARGTIQGSAQEIERLRAEHSELRAIVTEALGISTELPGECPLIDGVKDLIARRARLKENIAILGATRTGLVNELGQLRTILLPAAGVEPENWPVHSLADAATNVVEALAEKTHSLSEARDIIKKRNDQITRLTNDLEKARAEGAEKLQEEQGMSNRLRLDMARVRGMAWRAIWGAVLVVLGLGVLGAVAYFRGWWQR